MAQELLPFLVSSGYSNPIVAGLGLKKASGRCAVLWPFRYRIEGKEHELIRAPFVHGRLQPAEHRHAIQGDGGAYNRKGPPKNYAPDGPFWYAWLIAP